MESNEKGTTATAKQVAYIQMLKRDLGATDLSLAKDLSVEGASRMIDYLLGKMRNEKMEKTYHNAKINEPRLGMAMKECFRLWRSNGHDIYDERRELFKESVIKTYWLFTEIAEVVEQGGRKAAIAE